MKKKHPICPTCKNRHPIHGDGFEYLDCMLFYKKRGNEKKEFGKVMMDRVFSSHTQFTKNNFIKILSPRYGIHGENKVKMTQFYPELSKLYKFICNLYR